MVRGAQLILHEISNGCKADFEEEIVVYPGRGFRKSTYFLTNCLSLSKELKDLSKAIEKGNVNQTYSFDDDYLEENLVR